MLLPIIFVIREAREKNSYALMEINNKYESPQPKYSSWTWSRQLLRFKEVEISAIYMFDYLGLCHKGVCILSISSNTKGVNIHVQKKFRITLPWAEVRNSVAFVRRGLFNTCLFYVFYFDRTTSYREAKNLTDLMFFEVMFY
jgi:hypothetical protein